MKTLRLFFALDLAEDTRINLAKFQAEVQKCPALQDLRWVSPKNQHITLRFIGDYPEQNLERLTQSAAKIQASSFTLQIKGLGLFPQRGSPRVFWAGIAGQLTALRTLAEAIEVLPLPSQKTESAKFSPHLTLARIPEWAGENCQVELRKLLSQSPNFGESPNSHFSLYASQLTPQGPIYTCLQKFRLA